MPEDRPVSACGGGAAPQPHSWHFRATNTHLYPGARLRLSEAGRGAPAVGDTVLVEFADLRAASGRIGKHDGERLRVDMQSHCTARGTPVSAKSWSIEPLCGHDGDAAGEWRVAERAPASRTSS